MKTKYYPTVYMACFAHNLELQADEPQKTMLRGIHFEGGGWYSLDDNGVYRKGQRATYSRIKLVI